MRAGPCGSRELRIATPPPARAATSTQLPSALLCRLLIQRTPSELARTPFETVGTAASLHVVRHAAGRRAWGRRAARDTDWLESRAISREIARTCCRRG